MNAARVLVRSLPRATLRRLAPALPEDARADAVIDRFELDLCGLLNCLRADELRALLAAHRLAAEGDALALRSALWHWGACHEAGGADQLGTPLQPRPGSLGARLIHAAPPRGLSPPSTVWPRPLPAPRPAAPPTDEPDDVDALLAAATDALGVRLPARGRDKGAWGAAAAALLGLVEHNHDEPDWRGDVEVKTVPVALDRAGRWRVTEDPAVSMVDAFPLDKLRRVLWLVRASVGDGATLLSWYFVEWDAEVSRLVRRDLHTRPKGPRNTTRRGWYLHKRFFVDAGLHATLNGP